MGKRATELQAGSLTGSQASDPAGNLEEDETPSLGLFDSSADARVRILRRDDTTQKWIAHGFLPPDAKEEDILRTFGGGRYWLQLVGPVNGKEAIRDHRRIVLPGKYIPPRGTLPGIEDDSPSPTATAAIAAAGGIPSLSAPGSGDDLMQVLKAGIINTLLEMMKSTKEMSGTKPGVDPMLLELIKQQGQTQQQMMQFMMTLATGINGKQESETKDVLGMMAKFKELMSPAGGVASSNPIEMFSTMLEAFKTFREAADDVATPRGESDPLASLPRIAEVIWEQHQMQKETRAVAAVTHTAVPGPAGGVIHKPVVRAEPVAMPAIPLWQRILRAQAPRLISSAAAKHDPDVVAGMAITFAPADVLEALKVFFHRDEPEIVADILAEIPQMGEHVIWATDFVNAVQFRLFPDEFSEDAAPNADATTGATSE